MIQTSVDFKSRWSEIMCDTIASERHVYILLFALVDRKEKLDDRRATRRDDTKRENEKNTRIMNDPSISNEKRNFDKPRGGRRRENESTDIDNNNRDEKKFDSGERRSGAFGSRENRADRVGGFRDEDRGGGRGRGGRGRGGFGRGRGRREFDRHSGSDRT